MEYLLGIDAGLTVTKAALFDSAGRCAGVARRQVAQMLPRPRHVERDMDALWQATCSAIQELLETTGTRPESIAAVSQTAHGDGLYLLDRSGRPLGHGILSLDSRAADVVAAWDADGTSDALLDVAGQRPHASSPAAILAWIKAHDPDRFARIGHVIACKDWLAYCLTGIIATDRTEASTAFTNVTRQVYDSTILDLYGLPDIADALPPVAHSAAQVGSVTHQASALTGLAAGTPVAAGLHDVTASALGMNAHRSNCYALVAGTYSINQAVSDRPTTDARWFCRNAIEPGLWNNMAISPASTTNYDWFVRSFCAFEAQALEAQGRSIHAVLADEAKNTAQDSPIFHPYLFGSPFGAVASAGFLGLRGWQDRGAVVAGLLEGIVFNHKQHIDDLGQAFSPDEVRITGGVTRNPLVPQLFADALGRTVGVADVDEPAAQGAAACAGVAAGVFADLAQASAAFAPAIQTYAPDPAQCDRLATKYDIYRRSAAAVQPVWPELDKGGPT